MTGWPETTIVRGRVVVDKGKLVGALSHGEHIERGRSTHALPAGRQVTAFQPAKDWSP